MNILSRAWPRLSSQQENQPALGSFLSTSSFALSLFESVFRLPMVSSFLFLFPIPLSHAFSSSPLLPRFLIYRVGQLPLSFSLFSVVNAVSVVSGRLSLSLSSSFSVTRLFPSVLCGAGTPTVDRFVSRKHERTSSANVIHRFLFQRERSTVERRQWTNGIS